jgi:Copper type II ascorbate-dependent monooxygenase, C-terminal domain
LPEGVALKIEAHQMIGLEAHYINTGSTTLQGSGTVHFDTVPVTTANVIESDLAFFGTLGIVIPPGQQSNGPLFAAGLSLAGLTFDGSNGVAYQCTWNNTTGQVITFGESALQEMCFMWMYYYPSHGFDMRFQ